MDRRDFMKACGIAPVGVAITGQIMECWATNATFTEPARRNHPGSPVEISSHGQWWIGGTDNAITIRLYAKNFYCDLRLLNFAENVDWVRAFTTRREESPLYAEFNKMFGFGK